MKQLLEQLRKIHVLEIKRDCRDPRDQALILKLIEIIEEQSGALEFYCQPRGDGLPPSGFDPKNRWHYSFYPNEDIATEALGSTEAKLKALVEGE